MPAAAETTVSKMFINLPVRDLERSVAFFKSLGFPINEQFSNEKGACVVLGEHSYAMLLTIPFFETFTTKKTADTKQATTTRRCLRVEAESARCRPATASIPGSHGKGCRDRGTIRSSPPTPFRTNQRRPLPTTG